jgi:hypothetical protein
VVARPALNERLRKQALITVVNGVVGAERDADEVLWIEHRGIEGGIKVAHLDWIHVVHEHFVENVVPLYA